jgi:hypothetical protein
MHIYVDEHIHNDAKMFIFDRDLEQHKKNFKISICHNNFASIFVFITFTIIFLLKIFIGDANYTKKI